MKKRNLLNIFQDFCFGCNEVWAVPTIILTNEEGNSVIGSAGDYVSKNLNKFYSVVVDADDNLLRSMISGFFFLKKQLFSFLCERSTSIPMINYLHQGVLQVARSAIPRCL